LAEFEDQFSDDDDLLRFDTAKVYVDGILDLSTASLVDPYDVPPDPLYPSGFRYFADDQLDSYVSELHAMGYRINFHAVGDGGVRAALDAVESIADDPDAIADRRHRTTHNYLVHDDDLGRFAGLGVIADVQHGPDAIDPSYHDFLSDSIGDRAFDLIPTEALLDAGATVTLSSDWDADPLPPLGTIQRSLTRADNAMPDLATALRAHTVDAAYALGHDDTTGSIEIGKFADFVVLDQDLFDLDPGEIEDTGILATYLGGTAVFEAAGWQG
jgi:predicted amidohydrolase YtcJ